MKLSVKRGVRLSKIRPDWNTVFHQLYIYCDGKIVYRKHLNIIYDVHDHIEELKKIYPIKEIHFR
jgi:hypothetical protein